MSPDHESSGFVYPISAHLPLPATITKTDAPRVSPVWVVCALLLWLICNCCGHTGEYGWPSAQPATMICFAYCGHTGQSLLPTLLSGLVPTIISLLLDGTDSQFSCLQLASATDAGTPKGRAYNLHSQLRGLATATSGVLMYGVIFPPSQGRSHFGLTPAGAACQVWECRSHFGETSAEVGMLGGAGHVVLTR